MDLEELVHDIAEGLVRADASAAAFLSFQRGIRPYGEPQLVKLVAAHLNGDPKYGGMVVTKRTPDLLIPGKWAIEFKIARPFDDNRQEAENWSVNLLHPYAGNVSTVGDCLKLAASKAPERKAVIVVGYEHNPLKIDLIPLVRSLEAIASNVTGIKLGPRTESQCWSCAPSPPSYSIVRMGGLVMKANAQVCSSAYALNKMMGNCEGENLSETAKNVLERRTRAKEK